MVTLRAPEGRNREERGVWLFYEHQKGEIGRRGGYGFSTSIRNTL